MPSGNALAYLSRSAIGSPLFELDAEPCKLLQNWGVEELGWGNNVTAWVRSASCIGVRNFFRVGVFTPMTAPAKARLNEQNQCTGGKGSSTSGRGEQEL